MRRRAIHICPQCGQFTGVLRGLVLASVSAVYAHAGVRAPAAPTASRIPGGVLE